MTEPTDYLVPEFTQQQIGEISILGLAYIGDCVFEMLVRTYLLTEGHKAALDLHRTTVEYVNAPAQYAFYERICSLLTEEENAVYKRGRNAKVNSIPHSASAAEYHSATGLEALFGWLFLKNSRDRINQLFAAGMEITNGN